MVQEKELALYRLGLTLLKIIEDNNNSSQSDNQRHLSINSLRKLAAASSVEYSIVQKISTAKRNPSFTTIINLVDGFNLSLSEFILIYDSIPEGDVVKYKNELARKKMEKIQKKKQELKKKDSRKK
jgi:hypothetical protein